MREIKFRAWDKHKKTFDHSYDIFIADDGSILLVYPNAHLVEANEKDYIIQQWTGLQDKNGVEIYEGDIISTGDRNYEIVFHGTSFAVKQKGHNISYITSLDHWTMNIHKVIGNIFEGEHESR